jgi:hypothetical protein
MHVNRKPCTLHPRPGLYTQPRPQTLSPKPQTLNPKPLTLNPKLLHPKLIPKSFVIYSHP